MESNKNGKMATGKSPKGKLPPNLQRWNVPPVCQRHSSSSSYSSSFPFNFTCFFSLFLWTSRKEISGSQWRAAGLNWTRPNYLLNIHQKPVLDSIDVNQRRCSNRSVTMVWFCWWCFKRIYRWSSHSDVFSHPNRAPNRCTITFHYWINSIQSLSHRGLNRSLLLRHQLSC